MNRDIKSWKMITQGLRKMFVGYVDILKKFYENVVRV